MKLNIDSEYYQEREKDDIPERVFLRYVLMDAVERYRQGKREAFIWLFMSDNLDHFMSFQTICDYLGFDHESLRNEIRTNRGKIDFFGKSVSQICKKA